jgi:regulator of protease activity HflC (stomatin/prohibitin superfamily)
VILSEFHAERSEPVAEELPPEGCGTTLCTGVLIFFSGLLLILTFPFSLIAVIKVIPVYERAVIFRLGRIKGRKASGPGVFYVIPCIDKVITVDTRLKTFDVPPQSVSPSNP